MGEISESLVNGEFDYISGEYIGPPVGFARTFERPSSFKNKRIFSTESKIRGVQYYLHRKGVTNKDKQIVIVKKWATDNHLPSAHDNSVIPFFIAIQEDFDGFCKWFTKQKNVDTL